MTNVFFSSTVDAKSYDYFCENVVFADPEDKFFVPNGQRARVLPTDTDDIYSVQYRSLHSDRNVPDLPRFCRYFIYPANGEDPQSSACWCYALPKAGCTEIEKQY